MIASMPPSSSRVSKSPRWQGPRGSISSSGPNPTASYHVATGGKTKIVGTTNGGGDVQADIAAMTKRQPARRCAERRGGGYGHVLLRPCEEARERASR